MISIFLLIYLFDILLLLKETDFNHDIIEILFSDTSNKKIKKQDVKRLFEQHTSDYSNIQDRMLQLNEEKMALAKEKFEFKKKAHQEHMDLLISLIKKVDELTNIARSIAPQYLE